MKAFAIAKGVGAQAAKEARETATENPYTSLRAEPPAKYLTVPGRPKSAAMCEDVAKAPSGGVAMTQAAVPRQPDPMHSELSGGDWRCGYCENVNRARYKQSDRCNMRFCMAPRYLAVTEKGGSLSASAAKILQLQLAADSEAQAKEEAVLEDAACQPKAKKQKRVSLYEDQGGGVANPKPNRYKNGRRPGDPAGPGHVRVKR